MVANSADSLIQEFESQLVARGVEFKALDDGRYSITNSTGEITVALDNLSRKFERDQDAAAVARFLDSILVSIAPLPDWQSARGGIFSMIESKEVVVSANTITKSLSDDTRLIPVFFDKSAGILRFLRESDAETWRVTQDEVWNAAESSLDVIMQDTEVTYIDAKYLQLGVIQAHEPYKASLIRAPSLRSKVEDELGWPIYAVAPSRGFVFLVGKSDADELGRVVAPAVKEFRSAEYPISLEVWEIDDTGIKAVTTLPTD